MNPPLMKKSAGVICAEAGFAVATELIMLSMNLRCKPDQTASPFAANEVEDVLIVPPLTSR